jgi:hypothetical protein
MSFSAFSQSIVWEKNWGGPGKYGIVSNINKDSTIIIGGCWSSAPDYPGFFLKIDRNGNYLFQKYGRILATCEQDIHELPKGGYTSDVFIQRIDKNGDTLWSVNYPNS